MAGTQSALPIVRTLRGRVFANKARALPAFEFSRDLRLWVVPFDLESGAVIADGIPEHLKAAVGLAP